jgi:hypothetical protein
LPFAFEVAQPCAALNPGPTWAVTSAFVSVASARMSWTFV